MINPMKYLICLLIIFVTTMSTVAVDLHPKVIQFTPLFALNFDPRINPILLNHNAGEKRSDRRGNIECNTTLASP